MVTDDYLEITLRCRHCGSVDFRVPEDPSSDDIVTCAGCGAREPFHEMRRRTIAHAIEEICRRGLILH